MQLGIAAIYGLARPSTAVSSEAMQVAQYAGNLVQRIEGSDALFGRRSTVVSALIALVDSHADHGWDGREAMPVDPRAISFAIAFVRSLPDEYAMPDVGVDPDGAVSLDWMPSRNRILSISFAGDSDRLAYAWIDGTDRGHAVEKFDGERSPPRLTDALRDLTRYSNRAALRAA